MAGGRFVKYALDDIHRTWRDAVAATVDSVIRDIDPGQPDDRAWIDAMWRDLGWGWYIDSHGDEGYDEAPESWCGSGPAWVARHRLGEFLEPDQCVDVALRADVASKILPGTGRMYDRDRWETLGIEWPGIVARNRAASELGAILRPGVLFTVGDEADGSHICMVDKVNDDETVNTLEANSHGVIGDGRFGEGYVRRYETTAKDYTGSVHTVHPRRFDEIKVIYPIPRSAFRGLE